MIHQVDQRKHPRFLVAYGAVAALTESKFGNISDISRGGLTFSYIDYEDEDEDDVAARISSEVSIVHDPCFSLLEVPCKVIKDDYSPPDHHHGFLKMNRCRIQFYQLTSVQEAQIIYFIVNFAIGSSWETL
jgi:hypothetical protein